MCCLEGRRRGDSALDHGRGGARPECTIAIGIVAQSQVSRQRVARRSSQKVGPAAGARFLYLNDSRDFCRVAETETTKTKQKRGFANKNEGASFAPVERRQPRAFREPLAHLLGEGWTADACIRIRAPDPRTSPAAGHPRTSQQQARRSWRCPHTSPPGPRFKARATGRTATTARVAAFAHS